MLNGLGAQYPDLKKNLFNDKGELRHFVNVYKGSEDTRTLNGMNTPVHDADELSIVPSIAGGTAVEGERKKEQGESEKHSSFILHPSSLLNTRAVISEERADAAQLSNDEILRYSRHLILPEVNLEGQKKLKAAKVLLIGTGGLGSPLALYLAAAGVGTLGLVDFDVVDVTNLQRQIIHGTNDVGRPKAVSATETIKDINPERRM